MVKKNFYAVKVGKTTGIFNTWSDCETQVKGFPNAIYQGFKTRQEAALYMGDAALATPVATHAHTHTCTHTCVTTHT